MMMNIPLKKILPEWDETCILTPFKSAEDDSEYEVWKVSCGDQLYVLKPAKEQETWIYRTFLSAVSFDPKPFPHLYKIAEVDGRDYLLMEYVEGKDLCRCDRKALTLVLDALISLQGQFWGAKASDDGRYAFDAVLEQRRLRGTYLQDSQLEGAYEIFLNLFSTTERTFCHDDLLPFNVLVSDERAVLIDWEVGGMLPYPVSLARLIAHGSSKEGAFFWMTEEDKEFAIRYYYEQLIRGKGISWEIYRETLDYFLLYEYCEWIMLGNRYEDVDRDRFEYYRLLAKNLVQKIENATEL